MGTKSHEDRPAWYMRPIYAVVGRILHWQTMRELNRVAPLCARCGWRHNYGCWIDPCLVCGMIHTGDVPCHPAP